MAELTGTAAFIAPRVRVGPGLKSSIREPVRFMLDEFKAFALKGNMVDMAIGIVIGAAFATVVASLVDDLLMPIIAALFSTPDFSNLFVVLRNPTGEVFTSIEAAREAGVVALGYGLFINSLIAFLLVALALYFVVRGMNRMMEQKAEAAEAADTPPEPIAQEVLLAEIRDLLKVRA